MERNVKVLSAGFALMFFGYNGVQQYVTTYFEGLGMFNLGFSVLIVVYLSFMLASPISPFFVARFRAKSCMAVGAVFYSLFIVSLLSRSEAVLYLTAVLLGIAAAVLWTAQNTYIIRITRKDVYGASSGFFTTVFNLGTGAGIVLFGSLMIQLSFELSILVFAFSPVVGAVILLALEEPDKGQRGPGRRPIGMRRAASSPTLLRLGTIWFSFMFVIGLAIGILPIEINSALGTAYIGVLSSLFYILPIATSYAFGRLSDRVGRSDLILYSYAIGLAGLLVLFLSVGTVGLVMGIVLLAVNYALLRPVTMALAGDLSTDENLTVVVAVLFTFSDFGIFASLLISSFLPAGALYLASMAALLVSLLLVYPVLRLGLDRSKESIARELKGQPAFKNP